MSCLFNSFDPYFKQPFGAVRAGQTVRLSLCIPEELGYVDPHLVLKKEGKFDVPVYYRMNFDGQTPRQNHFSVEVPLNDPGLYFYYFDLYTDFRRIVRGPDNCGVISWQDGESWQITVYEQDFETPESIKGKVFYQIFPDRFCEGVENKPMPFPDRIYQADKHAEPFWQPNEVGGHLNEDYFGGDLKGIQQKLPYLHKMGVDFIYLNPIFEAHSNHRYNTADYLNVDPLLGTNEDFEALCTAAKKYGIGIVLDGVFSHTGSDSRYFNREGRYGEGGAYRDPNSPYRSWYDFDPKYKGGYRSWWGFETLPEVNEETPSYVEFITGEGGVIDTWLRRGAAGFRLDVADELPDDFIEKIRAAVKRVSPEKFLLGEVWEDATTKYGFGQRRTYLLGKGLDSVMNYPFKNAVLDFVKGKPAEQAMTEILTICEHYPAPAMDTALNFLSTHDTERARHRPGPRVAERPLCDRRCLRGGPAPPADGLRHHLHPAGCALPVLRRRDCHAGLPGPLQPGFLPVGCPRTAPAPRAGTAGTAPPHLRGLPHRPAAGPACRGRHPALPAGGQGRDRRDHRQPHRTYHRGDPCQRQEH